MQLIKRCEDERSYTSQTLRVGSMCNAETLNVTYYHTSSEIIPVGYFLLLGNGLRICMSARETLGFCLMRPLRMLWRIAPLAASLRPSWPPSCRLVSLLDSLVSVSAYKPAGRAEVFNAPLAPHCLLWPLTTSADSLWTG